MLRTLFSWSHDTVCLRVSAERYYYRIALSRLKAIADTSSGNANVVSNAKIRYVADPLSEDPGVPPPRVDVAKPAAATGGARAGSAKGKKGGGKKKADAGGAKGSQEQEEGGRKPILQVLRECVGERWIVRYAADKKISLAC